MDRIAENSLIKSAFVTINKILSYIEKRLDDTVFDLENFDAKTFNVSENRFYRYLQMLLDAGYISGIEVKDFGEPDDFMTESERLHYERFYAVFDAPAITIKGLQFLAENTLLMRMDKAAKSIRDIAP